MGQALYTSVTGMKAAQTQINVVANNIANVNTSGFKESNTLFSDVFYTTLSNGSSPTAHNGGTNPRQIGIWTQVAAIGKNFNGGSVNSTGVTTDMNIQGNGFFTVMDSSNQIYFTRAGNFTMDADGYLCMPNGFRVLGTPSAFSTGGSHTPIQVPVMMQGVTAPNDSAIIESKPRSELNNSSITSGTFSITVTDSSVPPVANTETVTIGDTDTISTIISNINTAISSYGASASLVDGKIAISAGSGNTLTFASGTSNFVSDTGLNAVTPTVGGTAESKVLDYKQTLSAPADTQTALKLQEMNVSEGGSISAKYSNGDQMSVELNDATGLYEFKYTTNEGVIITGTDLTVNDNIATPANFQMQVANFTNVNGLTQKGSNIFDTGPNSGTTLFGAPNTNGFGVLNTGGYENSNVDLTKQFSDMIVAQRAIEANSRVFNTQSQVLQNLNYLGQ
jgi:flagellar hook protein FlgE